MIKVSAPTIGISATSFFKSGKSVIKYLLEICAELKGKPCVFIKAMAFREKHVGLNCNKELVKNPLAEFTELLNTRIKCS